MSQTERDVGNNVNNSSKANTRPPIVPQLFDNKQENE